jgi:hypothetical protein
MNAALHHHYRLPGQLSNDQLSGVAFDTGQGEVGNVGVRNGISLRYLVG